MVYNFASAVLTYTRRRLSHLEAENTSDKWKFEFSVKLVKKKHSTDLLTVLEIKDI